MTDLVVGQVYSLAELSEMFGVDINEDSRIVVVEPRKCGCGHTYDFHPDGRACTATAADLDPGDLLEPVDDPSLPCLCTEYGALDD